MTCGHPSGLAGEPLPVYGDGLNIRDWLYVDDHVRALIQVLEFGVVGETYNVGGRQERTNRAVVEAICDLLDYLQPTHEPRRRLMTYVHDRPGHDRRYAIDPSKIETQLGWRAIETFESGLEKTVRWYWENQPWWRAILDRGYEPTRIGVVAHGR